jgi:hypothetical protein
VVVTRKRSTDHYGTGRESWTRWTANQSTACPWVSALSGEHASWKRLTVLDVVDIEVAGLPGQLS